MKYLLIISGLLFAFAGIRAQEVAGPAAGADSLSLIEVEPAYGGMPASDGKSFYDGMPASDGKPFYDGLRVSGPAGGGLKVDADPAGNEGLLKRGTWDFSLGTSFTHVKGFGSGATLYAAPFYTLPLNDRWSLHGGVVASHTAGFPQLNGGGYPTGVERFGNGSASYSTLSIFGAASYRLNDRLVLHGSGMKTLAVYPEGPPLLMNPLTPAAMDHLSVGATYQLGRNITIGASFRMENRRGYHGPDRFYGSPFHAAPFHTAPLHTAPFGSPYYW